MTAKSSNINKVVFAWSEISLCFSFFVRRGNFSRALNYNSFVIKNNVFEIRIK